MDKFLIAGLGNIGEEYTGTRHNIGFEIAEYLANETGEKFVNDRYAEVANVKFKGRQLVVIKPSTYMNLSGKAISYWMQKENIKTGNLMVLVDELALPFGKIRIGPKGSDGGHNGLRNIQEVLNTTVYPRMRFGIGNEFGKGAQINFVLGKWSDEEKQLLSERVKVAAEAIKTFTFIGLERCMNQFNNK